MAAAVEGNDPVADLVQCLVPIGGAPVLHAARGEAMDEQKGIALAARLISKAQAVGAQGELGHSLKLPGALSARNLSQPKPEDGSDGEKDIATRVPMRPAHIDPLASITLSEETRS